MKITIETYGETYTADMGDGQSLPKVIQTMCNLLVASGWPREGIAELFTDDPSNPFGWEVQ